MNDISQTQIGFRTGLASVLAIHDLRRRLVFARGAGSYGGSELVELLSLDPLTVLRLLRMAHAPITDLQEEAVSLPQLLATIGKTVVQHALDVPVAPVKCTGPLRQLWLHSIATAHAARSLAETSESMDPEEAYFLGLLHDLPPWLAYLVPDADAGAGANADGAGKSPPNGFEDWMEDWHLPQSLRTVACHERGVSGLESASTIVLDSPQALIGAAELLAELADFWHPKEGDDKSRELLLSLVSREDLVAAQNLRQKVIASLARFRLDGTSREPEEPDVQPSEKLSIFAGMKQGSLAQVVSSLLSCSSSARYRGIITATTAAALRYLNYDRAFMVQWSRHIKRCWIRAKADLSTRSLNPVMVLPNLQEARALEHGVSLERAQHMVRISGEKRGLLHSLGVDEVLAVPLNAGFQTTSFLVLDRTLSGRPVVQEEDLVAAEALTSTASILNENLLLKKLSQRAQKFALTDPLTRLYNRGVGLATLEREIARARRRHAPLTVLMLDLDEFKVLNDRHGHLAGDSALHMTAEVLRKTLRKTDTICRYGGEEFMIVLPDTTIEQASVTATRIFTAVEQAGTETGLPLTTSIGLTEVYYAKDTVETVLGRADRALYASKSRGRNRFSVDSVG